MAGCVLTPIGASDHPPREGLDIADTGGAEADTVRFPTRQFSTQ